MRTLEDILRELDRLDVGPDEIPVPRDMDIYIIQKAREILDNEEEEKE